MPIKVARELVVRWHYARGGSNTRVYTHGLFRRGADDCLGVAWWIPPTRSCAEATFPDGDWRRVLSLSRLVVSPEVPQNGASYLIGRSIRLIRQQGNWDCLVTYADDWQGHVGGIYRATNWELAGKTKPEGCWIDSAGRMVARKAGPKTRTRDEMQTLGHRLIGRFSKTKFRIVF